MAEKKDLTRLETVNAEVNKFNGTGNSFISKAIENFKEKHGILKFNNEEGFLEIDGIKFNISVVFDDVSEQNENIYLMSFIWFEIENINQIDKNMIELKRTFPTFFKLKKNAEELQESIKTDEDGYIMIGESNKAYKNIKEFKEIITLANKLISKEDIIKMIEEFDNYLTNLRFATIESSPIKEQKSNGGRFQTKTFTSGVNTFKIKILSESYESQSYATLSILGDNGYEVLESYNPKRDFKIDIAYKTDYSKFAFAPILKHLEEIATKYDIVETQRKEQQNKAVAVQKKDKKPKHSM